jgi:hypothetical protein
MLILPENIGYPIGETGSERDYYMFEIHYNNPSELGNLTFETGAKIYYTDEIREHDAGLMVRLQFYITLDPLKINNL